MTQKKLTDSRRLLETIVFGLQEKKGIDIMVLDLRKVKNAFSEYFVICSGNADTHVDSLTDSVEDTVKKYLGENAWNKEGKANREWILLDYSNIVVHIFKKEKRKHYQLEELWGDAELIEFVDNWEPAWVATVTSGTK